MLAANVPFEVPFKRHPHFFGREEDLKRVHAALQGMRPAGINPAGLTGQGGIGKTQLAVEYTYRYRHAYPDGIFWLNAVRPLPNEFAKLGQRFVDTSPIDTNRVLHEQKRFIRELLVGFFSKEDLKTLCDDFGVDYDDLSAAGRESVARELVGFAQRRGRLQELLDLIYKHRPNARQLQPDSVDGVVLSQPLDVLIARAFAELGRRPDALLVLDNLANPAGLHEAVQQDLSPARLPCHVLFTTRHADLAGFETITLNTLPEVAALELLLRAPARKAIRDARHSEHATAREVCAMLGYLPLALEIAAAHLEHKSHAPLAMYKAELVRRGALEVLEDDRIAVKTRHDAAVEATLASQWEALKSEETRTLLKVAGLLLEAAYVPVDRLALLAGIPLDGAEFFDWDVHDVLHELEVASLVEELRGTDVRFHPLVREFAARQCSTDEMAFRVRCVENLVSAFEDFGLLAQQCDRRGIVALQEDLLLCGDWLDGIAEPGLWGDTRRLVERRWVLQRLLVKESHNLHGWQATERPAFFLQQLMNRAVDVSQTGDYVHGIMRSVVGKARSALDFKSMPFLSLMWAKKRDSPELDFTIISHEGKKITAVAITPDGQRAIAASSDRPLRVWNLASGAVERRLEGHAKWVRAVVTTPNGRHAISASEDRTLRVWDLTSGVLERILEGHEGAVLAVAITPDGQRAISGSSDRTLRIWDLARGAVELILKDHADDVHAVAITPDGQRVISASSDQTLKVWNLASGAVECTLKGHVDRVRSVAVTPDGQRAISASDDGTLQVWDLTSGAREGMLEDHTAKVLSVAITPDGQRAISASADRTLRVWDLASGDVERTLSGHSDWVVSVLVTSDGRRAISASDDGTLKVWDLVSGAVEHMLESHEDLVYSIAVTPDGRRAISASGDKTLKVWNVATGAIERTLKGHQKSVHAVATTPDGQRAVSGSADWMLMVWNLDDGTIEHTLHDRAAFIHSVVVMPDGQHAISISDYRTFKVWDLDRGTLERTREGHANMARSAVVTPDGSHAITASSDRTLEVWNVATGAIERTLEGNADIVHSVVIMRHEQRVIATDGQWLKVWNLATGMIERTLQGNASLMRSVASTPEGQHAISASSDRTLTVWNIETGAELATAVLDGPLSSVAVTHAIEANSLVIIAGDEVGNVYCFEYHEPK